jgi:hypothetical protein
MTCTHDHKPYLDNGVPRCANCHEEATEAPCCSCVVGPTPPEFECRCVCHRRSDAGCQVQ